jgi:imidazolonepropionase-like amidohydrolase
MNRKFCIFLVVMTIGIVTPLCAQTTRIVAIRAGHLFDSKSGNMLSNQVVIVSGDKITDVGPADRVQIPSGVQVIDLSQATVLPGLIDAHTHVYSSLNNGARVPQRKKPGRSWPLGMR